MRAIVAIALMVVFFALAVAAIAGLIVAGVWLLKLVPHIRGRGILFVGLAGLGCFAAAAVVAWSILPRIDRFEPPGPELDRRDYPQLFALIDELATRTGQRPPAHVYLVHDANAFVTERGGLMGLGSRRVLGLGLPILQTLTVGELSAVIAHEYGHFHGGDTRLGPWIYKTRGAIGRTIVNLEGATGHAGEVHTLAAIFGLVQQPFRWFGALYLRITQAISRAQEYGADALAVRVCGAPALVGGLEKVVAASVAHELYLRHEVEPLASAGYAPPLGEGFGLFLASPRLAAVTQDAVEHERTEGRQDPYDSHPPLRERIAAARAIDAAAVAPDDRPALALVPDLAAADRAITEHVARMAELRPVSWAESGALLAPTWRPRARRASRVLKGYTPVTLPSDLKTVRRLAGEDMDDRIGSVPAGVLRDWATGFYGAALLAMLVAEGFAVHNTPGQPLRLVRGALSLEPYVLAGAYVGGELDLAGWTRIWTEAGIGERTFDTALRHVA